MLAQGVCLCFSDAVCPVVEVCVCFCDVFAKKTKHTKKVEIVGSMNVFICVRLCTHTLCDLCALVCLCVCVCVCAGCVISAVCVLIAC